MKPYPAYKDSDVEWLGEVPEGWKILRLKQSIATCRNGIWGDDPETTDDPIICVRVADFDRQALAVRIDEPTLRAVTESERLSRLLHPGNLLLEKSGGGEGQPVGAVVLFKDEVPAVCSNFVARIELAEKMHPNFWLYAHRMLYDVRVNVRSIKQTSGIQNLDQSAYFDEIFAFPPLPEQQAIARFLDKEVAKIDALVAEQRRLIALLAEKRQAVISHAVTKGLNPATPLKPSGIDWLGDIPEGWEVVQAGRVASVLSGFAFPSDGFSHDAADTPLLRGVNIGVGELRWDDVVYWCRSSDDRLSPFEVKVGDIVIGMDRPWISAGLRIAEVREKDLPCLLLQRVGLIRTSQLLNPRFLLLQYSGSNFRDFLAPEMTGVSVPHISPSQITSFPITLPAREEQDAIIAFLDAQTIQFDALTAAATSAISLLQERRAALISAAVTGKIDLRAHFAPSLSEPETA